MQNSQHKVTAAIESIIGATWAALQLHCTLHKYASDPAIHRTIADAMSISKLADIVVINDRDSEHLYVFLAKHVNISNVDDATYAYVFANVFTTSIKLFETATSRASGTTAIVASIKTYLQRLETSGNYTLPSSYRSNITDIREYAAFALNTNMLTPAPTQLLSDFKRFVLRVHYGAAFDTPLEVRQMTAMLARVHLRRVFFKFWRSELESKQTALDFTKARTMASAKYKVGGKTQSNKRTGTVAGAIASPPPPITNVGAEMPTLKVLQGLTSQVCVL